MKLLFQLSFLLFYILYLNAIINNKLNLNPLISLLNSNSKLFLNWNYSNKNFEQFFDILTPWIITTTNKTLINDKNPNLKYNNCLNPSYSAFLTGDNLKKPRIIIDFIPFGYDIDKLEIRLYEYYDIIDAFIIFESPITQTGLKKPLYFNLVRNTERFKHFSSKIIYLTATKEEMIQTAKFLNSKDPPPPPSFCIASGGLNP